MTNQLIAKWPTWVSWAKLTFPETRRLMADTKNSVIFLRFLLQVLERFILYYVTIAGLVIYLRNKYYTVAIAGLVY